MSVCHYVITWYRQIKNNYGHVCCRESLVSSSFCWCFGWAIGHGLVGVGALCADNIVSFCPAVCWEVGPDVAVAYGGRWLIVDGGKAPQKPWEVSIRGHWIIVNRIMTFFVLKLQLDEIEKLEGRCDKKCHISDLDCSLGPVDLCMTSRFCKKKSWRHKKGMTSIQRN
jgi:hypothetical protein